MGYTVIDVIDKAMDIAQKRKLIYENISKQKSNIPSIKLMSKVLIKNINRTIKYYEELKKELSYEEIEEIGFDVYDKISFLMNEFINKMHVSEINNVKELLVFSLNSEKDLYSLFVDIQGRLINNKNDVNTKAYKILSETINNKANHIKSLENTLRN